MTFSVSNMDPRHIRKRERSPAPARSADAAHRDGDGARPRGPGHAEGDRLFPRTGSTAYDALHYDLRLSYVPRTQRLRGRAIVTARAARPLRSVALDFQGYRVLRVRLNGRSATFSRRSTRLIVRPRGPALTAGQRFTVDVTYTGVPAPLVDSDGSREGWVATDDGAHVVGEPTGAQGWFPCNNLPRDKATLDLRMTVADGIVVIGNGALASRRRAAGRTTWHWRERHPIATYLTTATLGRFDVIGRPWGACGSSTRSTARSTATSARRRSRRSRGSPRSSPTTRAYGPYPFDYAGAAVDRAASLGYASSRSRSATTTGRRRPRSSPTSSRTSGSATP